MALSTRKRFPLHGDSRYLLLLDAPADAFSGALPGLSPCAPPLHKPVSSGSVCFCRTGVHRGIHVFASNFADDAGSRFCGLCVSRAHDSPKRPRALKH